MISIFLPIRKGSKRVKNKNIKKFNKYKLGLTELKIYQLKKLREKVINKNILKHKIEFIVSTDIPKVINFCKKFNWIKIHKRKLRDSGDNSLQRLINLIPDICSGDHILWTHVTSPLFSSDSYLDFIDYYLKNRKKMKSRSAFSADLIGKFVYCKKRKWISHDQKIKKWPRTQDLNPLYIKNSAAIIAEKKIYINQNDRLCNNPIPIIGKRENGFDIDDISDFNIASKIKNIPI